MKWLRYSHQGQVGLGQLVGDTLHVHQGSLFENPQPTGVTLPLSDLEVLAPCQPTKVLAPLEQFQSGCRKKWLERTHRAALLSQIAQLLFASSSSCDSAPTRCRQSGVRSRTGHRHWQTRP